MKVLKLNAGVIAADSIDDLCSSDNNTADYCHKFGFRIGGNQSDWLLTKAQVHQCRVKHKHNIEPWTVIEKRIGIPFNKIK